VVALALSHALLVGELSGLEAARNERVGIVSLNALTELAQRVDDAERLRTVVVDWQRHAGASSLRIVRFAGAELLASTDPKDVGESAAPRRLSKEEKPLYDQGQRLRAAIETNREEGAARKDEIELKPGTDGSLTLTGPLREGDRVAGLVQVVMPKLASMARPHWSSSVVYALLAVGLAGVAFLVTRRRPLPWVVFCAAAVGVTLSLWLHGRSAERTIAEQRQGSLEQIAKASRDQGQAMVAVNAGAGLQGAPLTPGRWDTDVMHQALGDLSDEGEVLRLVPAPTPMWKGLGLLMLLGVALLALLGFGAFHWLVQTLVENRTAYAYVAPAMVGMVLLVFFPFFYGVTLSFTDSTLYNSSKGITETWVGLQNYADIVLNFQVVSRSAEGSLVVNYGNFYWTLMFTIVWTISNVTIGVTVGLALALVLNIKSFAFRPVYRVLLILPWAVPNYITALVWKGMFHRQFGVINHLLVLFGGEPRSWFDAPLSSFATALATNGWLSFPFMMVVSLGALQSIPDELYEAAEVDGASRWQRFTAITLPALRPALVPAVILSVVWTFNMFNIIYLVTGGEPGGATEILVTQAYKHAFERYRYGYAAAYSMVIFVILLAYGVFQNKVSRGTEA
jgi:arabinogalactan oligomer/maltooligosaccharide transport system permease protein